MVKEKSALGFTAIIKGVYNTSSKETRFQHNQHVKTRNHTATGLAHTTVLYLSKGQHSNVISKLSLIDTSNYNM